jgi:uncharacterized membrane protein
MDKMLVTVFETETDGYKGLDALKGLDENGDITLYATAVLVKKPNGRVEVKQEADEGPVGTAVGMLTGAMVGLLGGPVGFAAGASVGGLTGLVFDAGSAGVNLDFLEEVSEILTPGKTAVLAEIDEEWVTPVNTKIGQLGGKVFRRPRYEVIDDQVARESEAFSQEVKELQEELKEGREETKAAAGKTLKSVQKRLKETEAKAQARLEQINEETKAKINNLEARSKNADKERKEKINKRIAELKADQKARSEKLQQARKLAREALMP